MDSSFSVPKANKSPSTSLENLMDTMFSSSYVCKATTSIAIKSEGRSKWVGGVLSHSTLVKSRSGTASQFPFFLIFWCLGFVVRTWKNSKGQCSMLGELINCGFETNISDEAVLMHRFSVHMGL